MKRTPFYDKYRQRLGQVLGSPTPWVFLFGALGLGLIGEGASKLVDALMEYLSPNAVFMTLGMGVALITGVVLFANLPQMMWNFMQAVRGVPQTAVSFSREHVPHRKGLITLVSSGQFVPAANAMSHHAWAGVPGSKPTLTHCWLIAGLGEGENTSPDNAERLKEAYEAKGVIVDIWHIRDADNVEEVFQAVKTIYHTAKQQFGLAQQDIIADYTGGTKSMTLGLALSSLNRGVDLQFMKPNAYLKDGRADKEQGSIARKVDIRFVTVEEST